jgi:hypothetical protein
MLTSLVAAIPAAYLAYELVMAMLSYSQNLSTVAYIVMGLTLLSAVAAALIPVAVLVGSKSKPAPEKGPATNKESGDDIDAMDDDGAEESSDGIEAADDDISGSSEFDISGSSDDILVDESDATLDTGALELFEEDEEEEVKPKSKKKKK